jgi:hypothetical protein
MQDTLPATIAIHNEGDSMTPIDKIHILIDCVAEMTPDQLDRLIQYAKEINEEELCVGQTKADQ